MKILYSDILPLAAEEGQKTILDAFHEQLQGSDEIRIATGYVSKASLLELDALVESAGIKKVLLIIGMYFVEGMPEGTYHTANSINKRWKDAGIGEIRMVRTFKYHGKLYSFFKDGQVKSAIIGSANLGVIKLEASNRRQYEVSALTTNQDECTEIASLISQLESARCSINIEDAAGMKIIREENSSLVGVDTVRRIPQEQVRLLEIDKTDTTFIIPIKVPAHNERFMDDNRHYTKSNLNVSYAAPRSARKARDWFETQFTVSKDITRQEGYPEKGKPFFVVTDDGYTFKAHTTSDGNKQFSAVGDELILGRWVKGRLAAAGLVAPVNNTLEDTDRKGMITKEMLKAYGCDRLVLTKTSQKMRDEDEILDVWMLSFEASDQTDSED